MKIVAVVPAFNEANHIGDVVKGVKKHLKHVVVVDDASKDKTGSVAEKAGADLLEHVVNLGKGAALKTGCDYAFGRLDADAVVVLDADMQHDPQEIPQFVKKLKQSDIVFSYRQRNRKAMPFVLRIGNKTIEMVMNVLFNIRILDTQCGYRAFTRNAYKKIRWQSSDYSVESEMIALAGKNHLRFSQIPIHTIYHNRYKGTTILDGIKIVRNMIWWRMVR